MQCIRSLATVCYINSQLALVWCGDYGAQHEMVEALVDLSTLKRSPWLQDADWSSDAQSLRELAIRTPWLVTDEFIWNHFKSLYLVDKCVSLLTVIHQLSTMSLFQTVPFRQLLV